MDRNTSRHVDSVHRPVATQYNEHPVTQRRPTKTWKRYWWVPLALLVALLIAAGCWWKMAYGSGIDNKTYQAVFLTNGQVFFGKLKNAHGQYLYLDHAYYTQKQELPADATDEQKQATASNVSLVKVGSEVYGPNNNMSIRSEQVLFWQNLKTDSKVTKAIEADKS